MALLRKDISDLNSGEIALIGIPFDDNSSYLQGPAKAPELIIDAIETDSANYFTEDLKDLDQHPRIFWCGNHLEADYLQLGQPVEQILNRGAIPFTLGGDHSITYPVMMAIAKKFPKLTILHFDAHGDLYDELNGNKHSHACPFARIMENGLAQHLIQVGIRTLNTHQKAQAEKFGVNIIQMKDWTPDIKFNIQGPVYLSFDIDVLDPAFAPGISHHEPGGFSTREVITIIQGLQLDIVGLDVVEYNPHRDINGVTAMVAAKVVKELISRLL